MTHDLIKNVLVGLDTSVHKVVVTELRDDTFYAVIWMEREGRIVASIPVLRTLWRLPCGGLPDLRRGRGSEEFQVGCECLRPSYQR